MCDERRAGEAREGSAVAAAAAIVPLFCKRGNKWLGRKSMVLRVGGMD